jgi:hypothetical protein
MTRYSIVAIIFLLLAAPSCDAEPSTPPKYREMNDIVASKELTDAEKVKKLEAFFDNYACGLTPIHHISRVDEAAARRIALALFKKKNTPLKHNLELGKTLLQWLKEPGFIDIYAPFLIDAVLEGGEADFCRKRSEGTISAVGEYAWIASDFGGHESKNFDKIHDKRVIPILTKCLNAPDMIYGEQSGCIRGEKGTSTKRNTQRQMIPVALAKLGAVDAIEPMRKILLTHHDYWLRFHSAGALATLMQPPAARKLEARLRADDDFRLYLFGWGQGLINRGDDAGIEFMDFKYSTYYQKAELSSVTYMVDERLPYIEKTPGAKAAAFYSMAFEYQPLRNILLFDAANMKYGAWLTFTEKSGKQAKVTNGDQALKRFEGRITGIYTRMINDILSKKLATLSPVIAMIGKRTSNAKIRKMSQDCVQALGK